MRLSIPVLVAALAAATPAIAQQPAPAAPSPAASASETRAAREPEVDRHCLKETGTRIRARAGDRRCTAFAGRVYSRVDIERTGEVDLAAALRRLDTSIY